MDASADALAAVRRASQVYCAQVAEQTTLSCGVAFTCPRYPNYADGNQLREVVIPAGKTIDECIEEVQGFYAGQGLRCFRWIPAAVQAVEPVEAFLVPRGYTLVCNLAMSRAREVEIAINPKVRLLPGRVMRKALREVILGNGAYAPAIREMLADVAVERLDDPQFEVSVALLEGRPAGYGALYEVGDIGCIENVFVAEWCRRRGVASSIVGHLLAMARRLAFRITCLETEASNLPAQALYARCGFEVGGEYAEFIASEAVREGLFRASIDQ